MQHKHRMISLALAFTVLVTFQSIIVAKMARGELVTPPTPVENCRTEVKPPWIDQEPTHDPCPYKAAPHQAVPQEVGNLDSRTAES